MKVIWVFELLVVQEVRDFEFVSGQQLHNLADNNNASLSRCPYFVRHVMCVNINIISVQFETNSWCIRINITRLLSVCWPY